MVLPLGFLFAALPPEFNSFMLSTGPGPAPMLATSAGYRQLATVLAGTAAASDGSMNSMSFAWAGPSANAASTAFRTHAAWLRQQAAVADQVAAHAAGVAGAYTGAMGTMPPLPSILAVKAVIEACRAATLAGAASAPTTAVLAAAEAVYATMWVTAASSMINYTGQASAHVAALPPPIPPPPIVAGTGPVSPYSAAVPPIGPAPVPKLSTAPNPTTGGTGGGPTGGNSGGGNSGGGQSGSSPNTGDAGQGPSQPSPQADNPLPDVEQAVSSAADQVTDPAMPDMADLGMSEFGGESMGQPGFPGTSTGSTTLAALNGGMGGMVAMGMVRGGLGAMSGLSTGFRMPSSWPPGVGTAFGAPATGTSGAPVSRSAPRRGVTAPTARMRRRRDDEKKSSKAYVPGEPQEVPVLEKPPVIGVIEYADDEASSSHEGGPGDVHRGLVLVTEEGK
ncbi:PPE domain-containing protein [Nocardia otitidiscaviarum]|uniref:PPE domain-containing protein n=1 Tax=Nocardia otitidiscaviarum TaxID=1823 RepID=UPI001895D4DF|nr:PPE domain-containing protein [Nocardia otitidiscaviarum]MBF6177880.1 PPE family protein [Nocardia otitidiscaviarum]